MSVLGIDLGGTRIKIGLVSAGCITREKIIQVLPEQGLVMHLPVIAQAVHEIISHAATENITGIGIAFPGIVDSLNNKVIVSTGKYEDAIHVDLVSWADTTFGLPLKMENDARMACLGEWIFGAGKNRKDVVMCTLGTGFGSSAITNGQLLTGKNYQAGILGGHSIIDYKNKEQICSCGRYGCVESIASGWVIKEAIKRSGLKSLGSDDQSEVNLLFELAASGNSIAAQLLKHCVEAWGVGIVNLIHAYDPELVIVGGGISHAWPTLKPLLETIIYKKVLSTGSLPELCQADFPDTAALYGAFSLFQKRFIQNEQAV
ncbi:ROK family protein [Pedobacter sp. Hv1]|uniref:ROK family protein n=1 Tax=Pedobacter sp. Hv1 TaxID=1740090 RepID=UPI0006D8B8D8|nr:ROK family protein [Pedobacter sp. Hv1]KQC02185.1 hypothetical protein AQF98_01015 [Pedobacter sp. Hv1]